MSQWLPGEWLDQPLYAPLRSWMQDGIPDLDVLNEARFVKTLHPDIPGSTLLKMLTSYGAEALGFEREVGTLTPGKYADIVVLSKDLLRCAPEEILQAQVLQTLVGGKVQYKSR